MCVQLKYPKDCGASTHCKRRFVAHAESQFLKVLSTKPIRVKFPDGSANDLDLHMCKGSSDALSTIAPVTNNSITTQGNINDVDTLFSTLSINFYNNL